MDNFSFIFSQFGLLMEARAGRGHFLRSGAGRRVAYFAAIKSG